MSNDEQTSHGEQTSNEEVTSNEEQTSNGEQMSNIGQTSNGDDRQHSQVEEEPFIELPRRQQDDDENPGYDISTATRTGCIVAVVIGTILAAFCLGLGSAICIRPLFGYRFHLSSTAVRVMTLMVNVVLTVSIDGMMLAHSISLRWALYREQRLQYNTNIRLFTNAKKSKPNRWYTNAVALFCLVLSYGASSLLFAVDYDPPYANADERDNSIEDATVINGPALVALGIGLAGQAAIAIWCLWSGRKEIPTWSSNALNNAQAAMQNGLIQHRPGRCMLSVHHRDGVTYRDIYPAYRQENMLHTQRAVRHVLSFMWIIVILAFLWPLVIAILSMADCNLQLSHGGDVFESLGVENCWGLLNLHWTPIYGSITSNTAAIRLEGNGGESLISGPAQAVIYIFLVMAFQCSQTAGLHCAELLVAMARDENLWRRAYIGEKQGGPGARLSMSLLRTLFSSWETITLSAFKAVLHWAMGQGMIPIILHTGTLFDNGKARHIADNVIYMVYSRLFFFALLALLTAIFATMVALRRPKGPQPATMGHLQTLVDLIDDWRTDEQGRMWWGDKTQLEGTEDQTFATRYAGTSPSKSMLAPIDYGSRYS